ncbi:alpha/beta-hydrolase [Hypoxylon sp. FL1857]|nr:alpha/beta-hydrolase [Hypoxylon sp. FL1857]
MSNVLSKQPFKTLYTVLFILKLAVLLPLVSFRYSLKPARPFPEWSLRVCVISVLARELFDYYTNTRSNGLAAVQAAYKKADGRFSLAEVAGLNLYSTLLDFGTARPAPVGGLWFPGPPTQGTDLRHEKVVIHFPGGAFVLAYGTDDIGKDIASVMSQHLKATKTFLAQYRISTNQETRFPAAIQDLVTFYHHLLRLGLDPKNIILSGDSAGGNLVIAFVRYLEDIQSPQLPLPAGALLWSPWVHVTAEAGKDYTRCRNSENDVLTPSLLQWGANAYLPEGKPIADALPFISPLHHPFSTSVPMFIHAGGSEAFFESVEEFSQEMMQIRGNRIRFHSTDLAPHDLPLSYKGLGMNHQMEVAARDAHNFFE